MKRLLALLVLAAAAAMACTPSDSGSSPGGIESPAGLESPAGIESPADDGVAIAVCLLTGASPAECEPPSARPAVRAVRRLLCRGPIL